MATPQDVRRSTPQVPKSGLITQNALDVDELFGRPQYRDPVGTGLGSEQVVEVATSRHFSVLRTAAGGVWTCGACVRLLVCVGEF